MRNVYLIDTYGALMLNAIKHSNFTLKDFQGLFFLFISPIMYCLNLRDIKTPIGRTHFLDREDFRSFVYGFFKTYFYYSKEAATFLGKNKFSVIVDVGANIGDFTLATAFDAEKVIAIEPSKRNFAALKENIKINSLTNVHLVNAAVTDANKVVFMQGNTSDMFVSTEDRGEQVNGYTLDSISKNDPSGPIDILKLDVQGHELMALKGMNDLLTNQSIELLIIEVHLKRDVTKAEVKSIMQKYNYQLIFEDDFLFDQPHLYFRSAK